MIESFLLKKSFFDRYLKINSVVLCFGCYDIAARQDCGSGQSYTTKTRVGGGGGMVDTDLDWRS